MTGCNFFQIYFNGLNNSNLYTQYSTKLSNVSSHRGQYHGKYTDERIWDGAQSSVVMTICAAFFGPENDWNSVSK